MNNSNGRHIFFVDDELKVRQVVAETLEQNGLHVSCFDCPTECLEQLPAQRCDLLITDLRMPKMDGNRVIEAFHGRSSLVTRYDHNWLR